MDKNVYAHMLFLYLGCDQMGPLDKPWDGPRPLNKSPFKWTHMVSGLTPPQDQSKPQKDWHRKVPAFCRSFQRGTLLNRSPSHEEWSGNIPGYGTRWLPYGQMLPVPEWLGGGIHPLTRLFLLKAYIFGVLPEQTTMVSLIMALEELNDHCNLTLHEPTH